MPLESTCRRLLNVKVFCLPIEYYGWNCLEANGTKPCPAPVPSSFHVIIQEFHDYKGELRALVGSIQEPGHSLDALWAAFCIRDGYLSEAGGKTFFDLKSNLGKFNIAIGSDRPKLAIDFDKPMMEWVRIEGRPLLKGYGYLSETETSLDQIHESARKNMIPEG